MYHCCIAIRFRLKCCRFEPDICCPWSVSRTHSLFVSFSCLMLLGQSCRFVHSSLPVCVLSFLPLGCACYVLLMRLLWAVLHAQAFLRRPPYIWFWYCSIGRWKRIIAWGCLKIYILWVDLRAQTLRFLSAQFPRLCLQEKVLNSLFSAELVVYLTPFSGCIFCEVKESLYLFSRVPFPSSLTSTFFFATI